MARFITLEGGDGAGKSTLLAHIEQHFKANGIPFVSTREPGGTPVAEEIREILLRPRTTSEMNSLTELLLYEAARAEHVERVIRPALQDGKAVLCDRFIHSTLAFQGFARGLGQPLVKQLNHLATHGLEPDLVLWLKLSPDQARNRIRARGAQSRLDMEKEAFHHAVFNAFSEMAHENPNQFIVLDSMRSPNEVFEDLLKHPLWESRFGSHAK